MFKLGELFVEVLLELEDDAFDKLNLVAFANIGEELEWLVDNIKHVDLACIEPRPDLSNLLQFLKRYCPMHLFHTSDFTSQSLLFSGGSCGVILVKVLLLGLSSQLTLGDLEPWLFLSYHTGGLLAQILLHLISLFLLLGVLGSIRSRGIKNTGVLNILRSTLYSVHEVMFEMFGELFLVEA